jgi:hypothetical protein
MGKVFASILVAVILAVSIGCNAGGGGGGSNGGDQNSIDGVLITPIQPSINPDFSFIEGWGQWVGGSTAGQAPPVQVFDCYPGSKLKLYGYELLAANASGQTPQIQEVTTQLTWKSSNTAVATIDSSGNVSCSTVGTTDITATLTGATCNISCSAMLNGGVTVGDAKHTLTLSPSSLSMNTGDSQQLTVTLSTETASGTTTEDVTTAAFTDPGGVPFPLGVEATDVTGMVFIDYNASNPNGNGVLVAGSPGSGRIWAEYQLPGTSHAVFSQPVSLIVR